MSLPRWKLPPGCTPGTWEYVTSAPIAEEYDDYFATHDLMQFDEAFVCDFFNRIGERGQCIADLGCGTGRILVALARLGFRGLGVDLSKKMLEQVDRKAVDELLPIETLEANWVQLDGIANASMDHCVSLFSSLGMIHGRDNRQRALEETHRILKPGGYFVFHVHNFWFNLYDLRGPWRVLESFWKSWTSRQWERGDKYYRYRGLTQMYLHSFTAREVRRALREAGFVDISFSPLQTQPHQLLPAPRVIPSLRAIGWMIAARRKP